jgi:hypothetical protein
METRARILVMTGKDHPAVDSQSASLIFQALPLGAVSKERQPGTIQPGNGKGIQEQSLALLATQPSDVAE